MHSSGSCLVFALALTFSINLQAQTTRLDILPDTALPFTLNNFYFLVEKYHPVARQAGLLSQFAQQEIRMARGNFDPRVEFQLLTKNFDDKEYYNKLSTSIKFPTYFPVDPSVGIDRNRGEFLNPENFIPSQYNYQQFYAGVSIPLGRGLLTDDRRIAVQQANLFQEMTEAEQIKIINKLLLDAAKDYWQWYYSYYNYRLLNQSIQLADEVFNRVKLNVDLGESSVIDSVQAKITLQQRLVEQREALLEFQNMGIDLSTYLWDSLGNPLQLSPQWAPAWQVDPFDLTARDIEVLVEQARVNHPELRKVNVKLRQLENERRLAAEYLKPVANVSYYMLNQPFGTGSNSSFSPFEDYKLGLDFYFPLLIRKERAKLSQTRYKITSMQWEQDLLERQIVNEINTVHNEMVATRTILLQQQGIVSDYERLLQAEIINLENGESDLFKINIQQEKLIQSQNKFIKLKSDYEKQKALLFWAAGTFNP